MKKFELNAFVAKGEDSQQQFKQNIRSIDAQGKIVAEALEKIICENRTTDDDLKDLKAPCERDNQCLQRKTVLTNGRI